MSKYSCIIAGDHITVVIAEGDDAGDSGTVNSDHKRYADALSAVREGRYEDFLAIANPITEVMKFGGGRIEVENYEVKFDGEILHNSLTSKMIDLIQDGFGIEPLANFMIRLGSNPSKRSVDELYGFLESTNLTITEDGYFVAYKRVREDYTDCHSGTFDNSPGSICKMERNRVDDDKDRTCSSGLHFCGKDYLASFWGERVVILKIDPADVVSIPSDYNNQKGRCCKYEVIGELSDMYQGTEDVLEGSMFTGDHESINIHEDAVSEGKYHGTYPTRAAARDACRGRDDIKFQDLGANTSPRWVSVFK